MFKHGLDIKREYDFLLEKEKRLVIIYM